MQNIRKLLFISVTLLTVCVSCKKSSDTNGPNINITKPIENQLFNMFDEIDINANICDDHKLSSVDVSITDESFTNVMTASTIYPDNNCYDVSLSIPITNIHLPSGYYYVLIRANDGANETKKFQKIHITTLPKKFKYLIVVSRNAGEIHVSKIDSTNIITPLMTLTTDYCGSAVSSDAQQFYIAGHYTGDVSVYSTIDWQLQWSIPCIVSPPFPYFEAIDVYHKMLYVSYRGGKFEVYNENGSLRTQRSVENGNYATCFMPVGNYLITYERNPAASSQKLVVYYTPSYVKRQNFIVNYEVKSIQNINDQQGLVFSNHSNYSGFKAVDIDHQTLTDIATSNNYPITAVAKINNVDFLFSTSDGIFIYHYPNTGTNQINNGSGINTLVYDEINNNYYFSENYHTIKKCIYPQSNPQFSVFVPDTILNILPVYNKD